MAFLTITPERQEAGGLLQPHGDERLRRSSSRRRASLRRLHAGPVRAGGLRPEGLVLLPERRGAQRGAEEGGQAAREDPDRARQPRGRGHPRDGQRGARPGTIVDDARAKFWKQVFTKIELHPQAAVRTGGSIGWMIRKNSPEEGARRVSRADPVGSSTRLRQHPRASTSRARSSRRTRIEGGAQEVRQRPVPVFRILRQQVQHRYAADGGAGLPGVAPGPGGEEPGRRGRRHAGDARDGQGAEGRRHPPRSTRTSTPASSTCAS